MVYQEKENYENQKRRILLNSYNTIKYFFNKFLYSAYTIIRKTKKFPHILNLELTNYCNLNCIMCPHSMMQRPKGNMDFELFKRIIEEIKGYSIKDLRLHHFGEPLLHPQLVDFIKYIKDNDDKKLIKNVSISTNCTTLTLKKAREIIESGLDSIRLCLDGTNKTTYEAIRCKANYKMTLTNIINFFNLRKKLKSKKPNIILQIINMKNTMDQINEFKQRWESFLEKNDIIHVQNFTNMGGQIKKELAAKKEGWQNYFPCLRLWNSLVICWDGTVSACCYDSDCELKLGKIDKEHSIKDIWSAKSLDNLRIIHLKNKCVIPLCKKCNRISL